VHVVHMVTAALGRVQEQPEKGLRNEAIERSLVKGSDMAVGVGPALADEARRLAGPPGRGDRPAVHEVIPGVRFERRELPAEARDKPNVLLFGRVDDDQKGAREAALMIRQLREDGIDARLTVRGVPPETVNMAQDLLSGLAGWRVEVRPYTVDRSELLADMRDAAIVVMPSRSEGFGLAGLEAVGAGVPVLVPSSSGVGRFIAESGQFPADIAAANVVPQGFEERVPVDRWATSLAGALGDYRVTQERALRLQQALRDQNRTWTGAAESLAAMVRALPDRWPERGARA